jgi:hypothetical protein
MIVPQHARGGWEEWGGVHPRGDWSDDVYLRLEAQWSPFDLDRVERRLVAGELWCPSCGGVLVGWGAGRSRCTGCGVTHVLLLCRVQSCGGSGP